MLNLAGLAANRGKVDGRYHLRDALLLPDAWDKDAKRAEAEQSIPSSTFQPATHLHLKLRPGPGDSLHYSEKQLPRTAVLSLDYIEAISTARHETKHKLHLNDRLVNGNCNSIDLHTELSTREQSWAEVEIEGSLSNSSSDQIRWLDYDYDTKRMIISAAINASLGFTSNLIGWNPENMRLEVCREMQSSSFSNYLENFAGTGTLIRRLIQACKVLREQSQNFDVRVAIGLASAIENEVVSRQTNYDILKYSGNLVSAISSFSATALDIKILADIIGCSGSQGKLKRIPTAVEILERAYWRACLLESDMLWRLMTSSLIPWLEQLYYVIGLTDPLAIRSPSFSLKQALFPEIFIEVVEESMSGFLIEDQVPNFMPEGVANAALECYELLCLLGRNGTAAMKRVAMLPADRTTFLNPNSKRQRLYDLERTSRSFKISLTNIDSNKSSITRKQTATPVLIHSPSYAFSDRKPLSIQHEIRKAFSPIISQLNTLNKVTKTEFIGELSEFRDIVTGLYFLHDSWLWSQLNELTASLYDNWEDHGEYLAAINDLVASRFDAQVGFVNDDRHELLVIYQPNAIVSAIFGPELLQQCQSIFTRIIYLNYKKQIRELAILGANIEIACASIDNALNSPATGLREVKEAFRKSVIYFN